MYSDDPSGMHVNKSVYMCGHLPFEEDPGIVDHPFPANCTMTLGMQGENTEENTSDTGGPTNEMRFIFETCLTLPIAGLGIIGNILAAIVLLRHNQRHSTTVLLQCLAVADAFILVAAILLRSLRYAAIYLNTLQGYMSVYAKVFLCVYPTVYFLRLTVMWLTVLLTVDRYIVVCKPLHAQRLCTVNRICKQTAVLVILAMIFSLPRFFEYRAADNPFGFASNKVLNTDLYTIGYKILLFFLCMYLIPIIIMVTLNYKLLRSLRQSDVHVAPLRDKSSIPARRGITAAVIVVVVATVICNMLALISHLVWSLEVQFYPESPKLETSRRYMSLVSNLLLTINSAINFIIYFLCSRNFRELMRRTLCCEDLNDYLGRRRRSRLDSLSVAITPSPRTSASGSAFSLQLTSVNRVSLTP